MYINQAETYSLLKKSIMVFLVLLSILAGLLSLFLVLAVADECENTCGNVCANIGKWSRSLTLRATHQTENKSKSISGGFFRNSKGNKNDTTSLQDQQNNTQVFGFLSSNGAVRHTSTYLPHLHLFHVEQITGLQSSGITSSTLKTFGIFRPEHVQNF